MSLKQLSRRVERTQSVAVLLNARAVRSYLAWMADQRGVDPDTSWSELQAIVTTWRRRDGSQLPAVEDLLLEEARATDWSVAEVRAAVVAELAAWGRNQR